MMKRVAIIGGGISGLVAARHMLQLDSETEVSLFESGDRVGGVIETTCEDGFVVERGPENFITSTPEAVELCRELGLCDQLVGTNPDGRGAMVLSNGKLRPIPEGFLILSPSRLWPLVMTPTLGPLGKLRAVMEYFVPGRRISEDESLQSFVCRRFGRELFERIVQPLVAGIYTGDANRLSVQATMPRFVAMEKQHGSLIRALRRGQPASAIRTDSGARYSQFMTLRSGMSQLIEALASALPADSIRLNAPVRKVDPTEHGTWRIRLKNDSSPAEFDGLILALPAHQAAAMIGQTDRALERELRSIEYGSCAIATLAYRNESFPALPGSYGFVVPAREERLILSCTFSSFKYPDRAPADHVLCRVFIGGVGQPGILRLPAEQLLQLAELEMHSILGLSQPPVFRRLIRQRKAMPQYHVGHNARLERIEKRLEQFPTLALAGSAYHGVGIPACIASGNQAAERVNQAGSAKASPWPNRTNILGSSHKEAEFEQQPCQPPTKTSLAT